MTASSRPLCTFSALCEPILIGSPGVILARSGKVDFQCSLRADPDWKISSPPGAPGAARFQCSLRADPDWKRSTRRLVRNHLAFSALCEPILIGRATARSNPEPKPNFQCSLRADPDWKLTYWRRNIKRLLFQCSLRADPDWKPRPARPAQPARHFQCSLRADPDWKSARISRIASSMALSVLSASRS